MADAVVLKSGQVVKIRTENYPDGLDEIYFTVVDGKVVHFLYKEVLYWYCHYKGPDYITSSERISQSFDGYYNYIEFLEFKIGKRLANKVSQFLFNENQDKAVEGDIITTLKTVFVSDYSNISTFDYEFPYDGITRYPQDVEIPQGTQGVLSWDKEDLPLGPHGFFANNYEVVQAYQNINSSSNFPSVFRDVILVMKNIVSEIFSEFTGSNNQIQIDQVINYWENYLNYYIDGEQTVKIAAQQITDLYNALTEFRGNFYAYKTSILEKTGNNFILFLVELAKVAPSQTFEVIDIQTKYEMLCEMVKGNMTQANSLEFAALAVIESVTDTQISPFLLLLLKESEIDRDPSKSKTLFEVFFRKIDDNRSARYSFGLLNSENNRAILIIILFKLWKKSNFNPTFPDPTYHESPIEGIYPESFYMELETVPGSSIKDPVYYKDDVDPPVITYEAPPQNNQYNNSDSEVNYTVKMEGKKIKVFEHTYTYELNTTNTQSDNPYIRVPRTRLYGTYDFYQPITIIGFKPDLGLVQVFKDIEFGGEQLQEEIPAFFLFYMVDYDDLATLDFSIMFAVELLTNFIPGVGALSAISKIRYLKYLSRARNLEAALATDRVVYWTAKEGINNSVEFFAGNALAVNNYIYMTTNDPDQQELTEKLNYFLGFVMVGSLYSNYRFRTKLINASEDVDFKILQMNADGKSIYKPGMSDDAKALLDDALLKVKSIEGNKTVSIDAMIYKLTEMQTDGAVILSKFTGFTPAQKYAFAIEYKDFLPLDLKKFNASNGLGMDNWKDLFDKNIMDRQIIDFVLSEKRTTAILRYYDEPGGLRNTLEPLTFEKRVKFLDEMGEISQPNFNRLLNNSDLTNQWLRYYDDLVLREEFKALGENGMITFIEKYGNIPEEAFTNIKYKPKDHIKHLMDFPDATHNIAYFNKRRAEMLPPPFKDADVGSIYGIQEIDSFIELELQFNGIVRPSLRNEAGDIIMQGGNLNGLSLDPMGIKNNIPQLIELKGNQFYQNWLGNIGQGQVERKGFLGSIQTHFEKIYNPKNGRPPLDRVVIDYKYFDEISQAIGEDPIYFRNLIDTFISSNFSQYNNSSFLIKLNY